MQFIELTLIGDTSPTIYVRADHITWIVSSYDFEFGKHTEIFVGGNTLQVRESPEEVLAKIS